MKSVKHYCLLFLTILPIVAVSFAAQSALNVAQIRSGTASNADLRAVGPDSHGRPPDEKGL